MSKPGKSSSSEEAEEEEHKPEQGKNSTYPAKNLSDIGSSEDEYPGEGEELFKFDKKLLKYTDDESEEAEDVELLEEYEGEGEWERVKASTTQGRPSSGTSGSDSPPSSRRKSSKRKSSGEKSRKSSGDSGGEQGAKEKEAGEEDEDKEDDLEETDKDEDEATGGGMLDLIGRSAAKREAGEAKQLADMRKQRRKRRPEITAKEKKEEKGKKKKGGAGGLIDHDDEEEEAKRKEETWIEPEYQIQDFNSGEIVTDLESCPVPLGILKYYSSYGYDSYRRNNLHVLDEDTVVYISGNYLHFFSLSDEKVIFTRRSISGYGLGHVAVHPTRQYFAVGEKGFQPFIIVYTWPDIKIHRVLRKGTGRGFAFVNFNPSGELLCSQGSAPDYMLTIWFWDRERIVLRCKAFSQDIYKAIFSPTNPGDLISSGIGHIRFWKMAETFTGLKLQGMIGRFGKTEISDIEGFVGLSDGKVISGCEWGNLLLWDGGLIVCEIRQLEGKPCHGGGSINDIVQQENDILTIGSDGFLRLWDAEVLDLADTVVDASGKFEVEPTYEIRLGYEAKLLSAVRCVALEENANNIWLIQDAYGKIWHVNLTQGQAASTYTPDSLFYGPGGSINAVGVCSTYTLMAVGSSLGQLWVIEYIQKTTLARKLYKNAVTKIIWLPKKYDPEGLSLIACFDDGTLRLLTLQKLTEQEVNDQTMNDENDHEALPYMFWPLQIMRYHKGAITFMKLDDENDILYTCGEDKVIFASVLSWDDENERCALDPISFVTAPFVVVSLDLHPLKSYRMVIASKRGRVAECRKPIWGDIDTSTSYNQGKLHGRRWFYKSTKSARRKEERRESRKKEKEERMAELLKDIIRRRELGIVVDEEIEIGRLNDYFRRAQAKDDEEELYIPQPDEYQIQAVYYHINKTLAGTNAGRTFFLHVGGYDSGYIYEAKCSRVEPGGYHAIKSTPPFTDDVSINCFVISPDNKFLLFGMSDGTIRVMGIADPSKKQQELKQEEEKKSASSKPDKRRKSSRKKQAQNMFGDESDDDSSTVDEDEPVEPDYRGKEGAEDEEENYLEALGEGTKAHEARLLKNRNMENEANNKEQAAQNKKPKKKLLAPFPVSFYPYDLENFWTLPMHDPDRGAVNSIVFSPTNDFVFSVGNDGSIYTYRWNSDGRLNTAADFLSDPSVPDLRFENEELLMDIEDPNAFTLEELKLKAEADRLFALSEAKKEIIRKQLRLLKSRFRMLRAKNLEIPLSARLTKEDFFIDERPGEARRIADELKLVEYYRTQEFDSAKQFVQMKKIQDFFFRRVETHFIVVKDLEHANQVTTFRAQAPSTAFWNLLGQNKNWIKEEELLQNAIEEGPEPPPPEAPQPVQRYYAKDLIGDYEGKTYDIGTMHAIKHLEIRLEKRYQRECELAELETKRIPNDWEDPKDLAAIKYAEDTMGEFKLKESDTFVGEKLTAGQRRQKILDLKLEMYQKMHQFNKLVILLKNEKPKLVEECRIMLKQLVQLQRYLPPKLRKPLPTIYDLEPCEQPEKTFDITREDVDARISKKVVELGFQHQKEAIEKKLYSPSTTVKGTPFRSAIPAAYKHKALNPETDMVLVNPVRPKQEVMKSVACRTFTPKIQQMPVKPTGYRGQSYDGLQPSVFRFRQLFYEAKNEPDAIKRNTVLAQRKYVQQTLYDKLYKKINYFKNRTLALVDEKVHLEMNLKLMQITLMNLFEELDISKDHDMEERAIVEKLKTERVECASFKEKTEKIKKRLENSKEELKRSEELLAQTLKSVTATIGEKHRFVEYLWKLFRRKNEPNLSNLPPALDTNDSIEVLHTIANPTVMMSPSSSSSSSSSSEVLSHESTSEVKTRTKQDYLNCPEGLEKIKFDRVVELRSRYRRFELDCETHRQIVHRITEHLENAEGSFGRHETRLANYSDEIRTLRKKKQEKLNNVDKIVIVKAHQIECMDESKVDESDGDFEQKMLVAFQNPDEVLAITRGITNVLDDRAEELKVETKTEEERLKQARHLLRRVREELLKKDKSVAKLEESCKNDMIRKFGRVVDLDQVCAAIINLELLNALAKLESRRNQQFYEQHLLKLEINKVKEKLMGVTKVNSEFNTLVAILEERQRDIEYYQHLQGKSDKDVHKELRDQPSYEMSASREIRQKNEDIFDEIGRLDEILWTQEMRIGVLRSIITVCKTKEGIPPLIPLKTIGKDKDIGRKFMTYQELLQHREMRNKDVVTIYKKDDIMDKLVRSESQVPFYDNYQSQEQSDYEYGDFRATRLQSSEERRLPTQVEEEEVVWSTFAQPEQETNDEEEEEVQVAEVEADNEMPPETQEEEFQEEEEGDDYPSEEEN